MFKVWLLQYVSAAIRRVLSSHVKRVLPVLKEGPLVAGIRCVHDLWTGAGDVFPRLDVYLNRTAGYRG